MSPSIKSVLITGANVGIGYDAARQLGLREGIEKVILGCRNPDKAEEAKKSLVETTGKTDIFEILIIDVSSLDSVRKAVDELKEPVDGLIMNAGGSGGKDPAEMTEHNVPSIIAVNVLGHVLLVDLLLEQKKLTGSAVYAGSEAARGIPSMGFPKHKFTSGSIEEFTGLVDGSGHKNKDMNSMYGITKLIGALWMSSMARKEPRVRFVTMSPGGTSGTAFARDMPAVQEFLMTKVAFPMMELMGQVHSVEVGAKRYVDALLDEDTYKSGIFYASKKGMTGPVVDQVVFADYLANELYQDQANEALHKFTQ